MQPLTRVVVSYKDRDGNACAWDYQVREPGNYLSMHFDSCGAMWIEEVRSVKGEPYDIAFRGCWGRDQFTMVQEMNPAQTYDDPQPIEKGPSETETPEDPETLE